MAPLRPKLTPDPAGNIRGGFRPIELGEVSKAVFGLAVGQALGPDVFERLPRLRQVMAGVFASIIRTGSLPRRLLDIYRIPLGKSGETASDCAAKRPTSLICAKPEMLVAGVLIRMHPSLEPSLGRCQ